VALLRAVYKQIKMRLYLVSSSNVALCFMRSNTEPIGYPAIPRYFRVWHDPCLCSDRAIDLLFGVQRKWLAQSLTADFDPVRTSARRAALVRKRASAASRFVWFDYVKKKSPEVRWWSFATRMLSFGSKAITDPAVVSLILSWLTFVKPYPVSSM